MKVKILKSTVGLFNCAYDGGEVADLSSEVAEAMIAAGYAEPIEKVETATSKAQPEKAIHPKKK